MGSQKLWRGRLLIGWKRKDLLICKYKVTFQPDGCAEPTCTATCFIYFDLGHRRDIWLLKCTFVMFYLFVYEKKLDGNCTRMLRAILNKSWRQHPTRHQLYGHLPPITRPIQVRRTRHAGHCWRSRDELISDELLWTPTHDRAKAGRPARTYIQQLCEDTGCSPEDLPEAMNDREKWR